MCRDDLVLSRSDRVSVPAGQGGKATSAHTSKVDASEAAN